MPVLNCTTNTHSTRCDTQHGLNTANTQPRTQPYTRDLQPRNRQGPGPRPTRKRAQEACPAVARGSYDRGQTRKLPPPRPGAASAQERHATLSRAAAIPAASPTQSDSRARGRRQCQGARAQAMPGWGAEQRVWENAPGDAGSAPGKSRMSAQQRRLRGSRSGGNGRRAAC